MIENRLLFLSDNHVAVGFTLNESVHVGKTIRPNNWVPLQLRKYEKKGWNWSWYTGVFQCDFSRTVLSNFDKETWISPLAAWHLRYGLPNVLLFYSTFVFYFIYFILRLLFLLRWPLMQTSFTVPLTARSVTFGKGRLEVASVKTNEMKTLGSNSHKQLTISSMHFPA